MFDLFVILLAQLSYECFITLSLCCATTQPNRRDVNEPVTQQMPYVKVLVARTPGYNDLFHPSIVAKYSWPI